MGVHSLRPADLIDGPEIDVVTIERLERRLTEEVGAVRLDISGLRAEMIDRSSDQLKWLLGFFIAQTAALAALLTLLR